MQASAIRDEEAMSISIRPALSSSFVAAGSEAHPQGLQSGAPPEQNTPIDRPLMSSNENQEPLCVQAASAAVLEAGMAAESDCLEDRSSEPEASAPAKGAAADSIEVATLGQPQQVVM